MTWLADLNILLGLENGSDHSPPAEQGSLFAHSADYALSPAPHAESEAPAPILPPIPLLLDGMSIPDHFTLLGSHDALMLRYGDMPLAFRLWDSARLWERDYNTDRQPRWEAQYRAALQQLERLLVSHQQGIRP